MLLVWLKQTQQENLKVVARLVVSLVNWQKQTLCLLEELNHMPTIEKVQRKGAARSENNKLHKEEKRTSRNERRYRNTPLSL